VARTDPDLLVLAVRLHVLDPGDLSVRMLLVLGHQGPPVGVPLVVVLLVHRHRRAELLLVGETHAGPGLLARLGEDPEKDRRQDGDDGNHDEQLNQRKAGALAHAAARSADKRILRSHGPSSVARKAEQWRQTVISFAIHTSAPPLGSLRWR